MNPDEEPTVDLGPAADAWIAHGLLFALNEAWAHSRGIQFVMLPNGNIGVRGDKSQLRNWNHVDPAAVDGAWRRSEQVVLTAQGQNKRLRGPRREQDGWPTDRAGDVGGTADYQQDDVGHSPGFRQPFGSNPTTG